MGVEDALACAPAVEGETGEWLSVRSRPEALGPGFAPAAEVDCRPVPAREEDPCRSRTARAGQHQEGCKKEPHRSNPSETARPEEPWAFTPLQALHCYWTG